MGNQKQHKALSVFIALVTFTFAVVKMPLEMALLLRAVPQKNLFMSFTTTEEREVLLINTFDAACSYHVFHRDLQAVDVGDDSNAKSKLLLEDAELSKKVKC